jgi:hypothetical protein
MNLFNLTMLNQVTSLDLYDKNNIFLYSVIINNARYGPKRIVLLCIVENNTFSSIVNINYL